MNLKRILVLGAIALIGLAAPKADAHTFWSVGVGFGNPYGGFGYPYYGYPYYGYYPYRYPYGYGYSYYPYGYSYSYRPYSYGYYSRPTYRGQSARSNVVVRVQERLTRAGYYHGGIDGVVGPRTRYAIRAYERDHGLRADGVITNQLLATMGLRY
jgi:hypothetical protein